MASNPRIAFIGAGNMANAIIGGLIAKGVDPSQIIAADPYQPSLDSLHEQHGVACAVDNTAAVAGADVVVLAVKPQVLETAVQEIKDSVHENSPLLLSIVAGISVASMESWLDGQPAIVRSMPNTPALVQCGATALFANSQVSDAQRSNAESIASAIGITAWVEEESLLDAVTAISGSGPAYYFAIMEAMQSIAQDMGLDAELAERFVHQTALGAAQMAINSDVDVGELRRRVSSPGGTTLAALERFESGNLHGLFATALEAARQRAQDMAKEFG
ncbi:MAG: pyrroline-5-carboxylate reductase [Pseudomonadales bacterium]